jgi:hypothetical protein
LSDIEVRREAGQVGGEHTSTYAIEARGNIAVDAVEYTAAAHCVAHYRDRLTEEMHMSKGMDQKKQERKKPAKTLEEKRAAKKAKKEARSSSRAM